MQVPGKIDRYDHSLPDGVRVLTVHRLLFCAVYGDRHIETTIYLHCEIVLHRLQRHVDVHVGVCGEVGRCPEPRLTGVTDLNIFSIDFDVPVRDLVSGGYVHPSGEIHRGAGRTGEQDGVVDRARGTRIQMDGDGHAVSRVDGQVLRYLRTEVEPAVPVLAVVPLRVVFAVVEAQVRPVGGVRLGTQETGRRNRILQVRIQKVRHRHDLVAVRSVRGEHCSVGGCEDVPEAVFHQGPVYAPDERDRICLVPRGRVDDHVVLGHGGPEVDSEGEQHLILGPGRRLVQVQDLVHESDVNRCDHVRVDDYRYGLGYIFSVQKLDYDHYVPEVERAIRLQLIVLGLVPNP